MVAEHGAASSANKETARSLEDVSMVQENDVAKTRTLLHLQNNTSNYHSLVDLRSVVLSRVTRRRSMSSK